MSLFPAFFLTFLKLQFMRIKMYIMFASVQSELFAVAIELARAMVHQPEQVVLDGSQLKHYLQPHVSSLLGRRRR